MKFKEELHIKIVTAISQLFCSGYQYMENEDRVALEELVRYVVEREGIQEEVINKVILYESLKHADDINYMDDIKEDLFEFLSK